LKCPTPKKKVCNFVGADCSPILANIYLHTLDCKIRQAIEVYAMCNFSSKELTGHNPLM
jgi:hypothetical protein